MKKPEFLSLAASGSRFEGCFNALAIARQILLSENGDCSGHIAGGSIETIPLPQPRSELQLDGIDAARAVTAIGLRGMPAAIARLALVTARVGQDLVAS